MTLHFDFIKELENIISNHIEEAGIEADKFQAMVQPADPRFGDFQANGAFAYAKQIKKNPREVATKLLECLKKSPQLPSDSVDIQIAGPGFINFKFSPQYLLNWLQHYHSETSLRDQTSTTFENKKVVVDFSSPNTAKQMHVGHIRSAIIGETICRLLSFSGATVIRDNHIGDWGTQFGILTLAIKKNNFSFDDAENALEEIEDLYREGNKAAKEDADTLNAARQELVKLQNGDSENLAIWKKINEISYKAFDKIYKTLDVTFDHVLGESHYRDQVDRVYKELADLNIAEESDGALVVFHKNHPRFAKQPFIIRKKDGASNYGTTDLATVLFRKEEWEADKIVYVTDGRQQDHFEQLFLTVNKWFEANKQIVPNLTHVWFGTILGSDGKAIKTRDGSPILLKDLLNEAVERALAIVSEKNPDLSPDEQKSIATTVGLAAVRYADLSQNRTSDYVFEWDKILSFEGNTAPYLLYAVARIHSIFRKLELQPGENEDAATAFETDEEIALARKIMAYPVTLNQTITDLKPHFLCTYLYQLAGTFSSFYNSNKVNVEDPAIKSRRLILCSRTLTLLKTNLKLLGIETIERM